MEARFWKNTAVAVAIAAMIFGCSSPPPVRPPQEDIEVILLELRRDGAEELLLPELKSVEETVAVAKGLLAEGKSEESERYLKLAHLKASLLQRNLFQLKVKMEEERVAAEKLEQERQEEESHGQPTKDRNDVKKPAERGRREREKAEKSEKPLLATYTVKRGETLPQIAALPEVYNDASLWPLLYRANRDQIRDPNIIWPGQVLQITRNITREDIAEARKYAQNRPLH